MRLIDADALLETSIRITGHFDLPGGKVQNFEAISVKAIESAPTIDPVRRGKWERIINAYGELEGFMCECGCQSASAPNFCPSCGARMDGE